MLLIGGHALRYHLPNEVKRTSLDTDFICTYDEYEKWKQGKEFYWLMPENKGKKIVAKSHTLGIFEFEIAWPNSTAEQLLELIKEHSEFVSISENEFVQIPNLDTLYTIKMSHRYLKNNPHFLKTMRDIQLMRKHGAKIPDYLKDWYKKRRDETYDYSHPNLKQNKDGFFDKNQGVTYVYDHDSVHLAMAHLDKPAYEYYKGDTAEVFCDRSKFETLPELTKLYGVLEEAYVLALERSQIPFGDKIKPRDSFLIAIQKVCTSITSGWFREFAWENYDKVVELYREDYVQKFMRGVEKGIVKKL